MRYLEREDMKAFVDITKRLKLKIARRQMEEKPEAVVEEEAAPDAIVEEPAV